MYKLTNTYYISFFKLLQKKINIHMKNFTTKKQKLRAWARNRRYTKDFGAHISELIKNISKTFVYNSSQNLMLFYPLPKEINLLPLIETNKTISFPCIKENELVPYLCGNEFCCAKYNIKEPINTQKQKISELDLVFLPALCADLNGYRVGYGKGYYDRFIRKLDRKRTKLITVVWDEFIVDDIEPDFFDEKSDFIISEKRIIEISERPPDKI